MSLKVLGQHGGQTGDVVIFAQDTNGNPVGILVDTDGNLQVDIAGASGVVEVIQDTHDDLNANVNIQISDTDVSGSNPIPIIGQTKSINAFTQITTNLDNQSNQYIGTIDTEGGDWHEWVAYIEIVQGASDESTKSFFLYWAETYEALGTPANCVTILSTCEQSYECELVDASGGATTRVYRTSVYTTKGTNIYFWYDVEDLGTALTSVDVIVIKLS